MNPYVFALLMAVLAWVLDMIAPFRLWDVVLFVAFFVGGCTDLILDAIRRNRCACKPKEA